MFVDVILTVLESALRLGFLDYVEQVEFEIEWTKVFLTAGVNS